MVTDKTDYLSHPRFKSFLWAGYECTYALSSTGVRYDYLQSTKHDVYTREDFKLLEDLGIQVAREGLSWHQIDKGNGVYDFSRFEKIMKIGQEEGIQIVWDLNHFDYPENVDPFTDAFIHRFREHAVQAIKIIRRYTEGTIYIVPINEISFFSFVCDIGMWAPYAVGRGFDFKKQLVRASIAAMDAIWEVDPDVRFIQVDPIMYRAPRRPSSVETRTKAKDFNQIRFQSWDMLAGKLCPELGGSQKYLDIIGLNYYFNNQQLILKTDVYKNGCLKDMPWESSYRLSFAKILGDIYKRYRRPMVVTETGSHGTLRDKWWKRTLKEIDEGLKMNLPIYGVCAYPIVDREDWTEFHLTNSGLWDYESGDKDCRRIPHTNSIATIKQYIKKWSFNNVAM